MIDDHSLLNEVRGKFMVMEGLLRTLSALGSQGRCLTWNGEAGVGK